MLFRFTYQLCVETVALLGEGEVGLVHWGYRLYNIGDSPSLTFPFTRYLSLTAWVCAVIWRWGSFRGGRGRWGSYIDTSARDRYVYVVVAHAIHLQVRYILTRQVWVV